MDETIHQDYESLNPVPCNIHSTFVSVILTPTRKTSSPMKRLRQRFLWMVLRSLCRPRKKQKVKRLMARQTRDTAMPILVMTVRRSSWTLPSPCRETDTARTDLHLHTCHSDWWHVSTIIAVAVCIEVRTLTLLKPWCIQFVMKMQISQLFSPWGIGWD